MGRVWDPKDPSQPPGIPPSRGRCGVFLGHPKSGRSLGTPPCHPPRSGSAWRSEINPWRSSRKSSGAAESPPPLPDPRPELRGFVTSVTFVTFVTSTPRPASAEGTRWHRHPGEGGRRWQRPYPGTDAARGGHFGMAQGAGEGTRDTPGALGGAEALAGSAWRAGRGGGAGKGFSTGNGGHKSRSDGRE